MTDDEFFIESLKKVTDLFKNDPKLIEDLDIGILEYAEDADIEDDEEKAESYAVYNGEDVDLTASLENYLQHIKSIDDVFELSVEDYNILLSCLEAYAEVFVIDGTDEEKLNKSEEEYDRLMSILNEFWIDEDDIEDSEDE